MSWQQLKQPDLSVTGARQMCLKYAREVFDIGPVYLKAWNAWEAAKYAHRNRDFPPVAVPVWFKHPANGTTPGHVAVRLANGKIYSSPYGSLKGHAVLNSIEDVERHYNSKYVGWSEDINNVRVAQEVEEEMISTKERKEILTDYQKTYRPKNPLSPADIAGYLKPEDDVEFVRGYFDDLCGTLNNRIKELEAASSGQFEKVAEQLYRQKK